MSCRFHFIRLLLPAAVIISSLPTLARGADQPEVEAKLKPYWTAAERIVLAVNENDAKQFPQLLDVHSMMDRVFATLPNVPEDYRNGFEQPMRDLGRQLMSEWANAVIQGGGFKLLDVRMVDGEPRGIVRLLAGPGFSYIELIFSTDGGPPRMVDTYIALSGEKLSQTFSRMAAIGAGELQGAVPGDGLIAHGKTMGKISVLVRNNLPDEALAAYNTLPEKLQKEKSMMLMLVMIRMKKADTDPKAYTAAIDAYSKAFPNDLAVDLVTLDAHFIRKEFAEGRATVDRIDKLIGGDPYLNIPRATLYMAEGKIAEARTCLDKAIQAEPDLKAGHMVMLDIALAQKDFARLAEALKVLETQFGMDLPGVATAPLFEEFRNSPEYKKWQESR